MQSQFFSLGALLFYALIGSVIASFVWMVRNQRATASNQTLNEVREEDRQIRAENLKLVDRCNNLQNELAAAQRELASLKAETAAEQERHQQVERLVQNAPKMRIEYTGRVTETLEFINDGPGEVSNTVLGPLLAVRKEEHLLHLHQQIPTAIPEQHREAVRMHFKPNPTEPGNSVPLGDWVASLATNSEVSISVNYHGPQRIGFSRNYTLRSFPGGKLVWNPGPIKILDSKD